MRRSSSGLRSDSLSDVPEPLGEGVQAFLHFWVTLLRLQRSF